MIAFEQLIPCAPTTPWLDTVNAIFNGLQMLLLTWLGNRMGHMAHNSDLRLKRDLNDSSKA